MDKKKILIVEDDKMLSQVFEMFLNDLGYDVIGFYPDGNSAIAKCEEIRPDVILMDIHISGEKNGFDTAKIIHEKFDIPVLYLSSDNEAETIKSTIYTNIYGYLLKPTNKKTLNTSIEFAYQKHKYFKENRL